MRRNLLVGLIIIIAFVFRLILSPLVFHADLLSQASWGEYVANSGPKNLYSYNVWTFSWPNHPPLTSLYYGLSFDIFRQLSLRLHQSVLVLNKLGISQGSYFNFVDSFDRLVSPEIPYSLGFMLSLKLLPILSDLLIGLVIWFLAVRQKVNAFKFVGAYLLLPFSWYISALWGQTDQLAFLFVLISFILILRFPFWSILMFFVGVSIKPTSVFLVPLFLFIIYKSKPRYILVFLGFIVCLMANYFIFKSFSDENTYKFTFERLLPRIMDRPARLTTNAFNLWHIYTANKNVSNDFVFLFLSGKVWGFILFAMVNIVAIFNLKKLNLKNIILSLFIVGFGGWLFMTDMLERYVFAGIVFGLILSIYKQRVFKYWLILSLIYWINLFRGWWYPSELYGLKDLLTFNNYIIGRLFSLINLIVYWRMIWVIIKDKNELSKPKI